MLGRILDSMQQAVIQKPVSGSLDRPFDRLLILVGHDTNLTNISGAMDLSWLIDGRRDDTPPGGALVFELWQDCAASQYRVRAFFTAQTVDQMRNTTPLSLDRPPERVPVFIPACSGADASCDWSTFRRAVQEIISSQPAR